MGLSGQRSSSPVVSPGSYDGLGSSTSHWASSWWPRDALHAPALVVGGWPWSRVALAVSTTSPARCPARSSSSVSGGSDELSAGVVGSARSAFGFVAEPEAGYSNKHCHSDISR